jgi:flavin reductase (DIM6/NTAB) family NADH-FMN oxidoreductase RutF
MLDQHSRELEGLYEYCPAIAMIVTVCRGSEKNAMAAAWHSPISFDPPLYGVSISSKRHTHQMILDAKEFGVNFVPFDLARLVAQTGGCSGRDVDKFETFRIEKTDPLETTAPIIRDSYGAYECRLLSSNTYGDHDWFVGEIVAVHTDSSAFDGDGVIDVTKAVPTLYLGMDRYLQIKTSDSVRLDRSELADSHE